MTTSFYSLFLRGPSEETFPLALAYGDAFLQFLFDDDASPSASSSSSSAAATATETVPPMLASVSAPAAETTDDATEAAVAPSHVVTPSAAAKPVELVLKWCDWLLCGTSALASSPDAVFAALRATNRPRVCTRSWTNECFYRCRDCQLSEASSCCVECFRAGPHEAEGHDFVFESAQATYGGCCDCGNPHAWKPAGNCPAHGQPLPDPLALLTDAVRAAAPAVVGGVVRRLLRARLHDNAAHALHYRVQLAHTEAADLMRVVAWLRRAHDTSEGLSALARDAMAQRWRRDDADGALVLDDVHGRSTLHDLLLFMRAQPDDAVADEDALAEQLGFFTLDLIQDVAYKRVFAREFLRIYPLLARAALADTEMSWKLSPQIFTMSELCLELCTRDAVEAAADYPRPYLLHVLVTMLERTNAALIGVSRRTGLTHFDARALRQRDMDHWTCAIENLTLVLEHDAVAELLACDARATGLFVRVAHQLALFQAMDEQKRARQRHVEYESRAYLTALTFEATLDGLARRLLDATHRVVARDYAGSLARFGGATDGLARVAVLANMLDWWSRERALPVRRSHGVDVVRFKVCSRHVSVHLPLHRVFVRLLYALASFVDDAATLSAALGRVAAAIESAPPPAAADVTRAARSAPCLVSRLAWLRFGEHAMHAQAFVAQVRAGMWTRNGQSMRKLCYMYRTCTSHRGFDADLLACQMTLCVIGSRTFTWNAARRFRVLKFFARDYEDVPTTTPARPERLALAEEFFAFIVCVVQHRAIYVPSAPAAARRVALQRELLHLLAVGDQTRSSVTECVARVAASRNIAVADVDAALDGLARFLPPTLTHVGTYRLERAAWRLFEPCWPAYEARSAECAREQWTAARAAALKEAREAAAAADKDKVWGVRARYEALRDARVLPTAAVSDAAEAPAAALLAPSVRSGVLCVLSDATLLLMIYRTLLRHVSAERLDAELRVADDVALVASPTLVFRAIHLLRLAVANAAAAAPFIAAETAAERAAALANGDADAIEAQQHRWRPFKSGDVNQSVRILLPTYKRKSDEAAKLVEKRRKKLKKKKKTKDVVAEAAAGGAEGDEAQAQEEEDEEDEDDEEEEEEEEEGEGEMGAIAASQSPLAAAAQEPAKAATTTTTTRRSAPSHERSCILKLLLVMLADYDDAAAGGGDDVLGELVYDVVRRLDAGDRQCRVIIREKLPRLFGDAPAAVSTSTPTESTTATTTTTAAAAAEPKKAVSDAERRRAAAKARQAAIMARFRTQQTAFATAAADDDDDDDDDDDGDNDGDGDEAAAQKGEETKAALDDDEQQERVQLVAEDGAATANEADAAATTSSTSFECVLCRSSAIDESPLGSVAMLSRSDVLRLATRRAATAACAAPPAAAAPPASFARADGAALCVNIDAHTPLHVYACGHHLHWSCFVRYVRSTVARRNEGAPYEGEHAVLVNFNEFICPVCRRLANCLLPLPVARAAAAAAAAEEEEEEEDGEAAARAALTTLRGVWRKTRATAHYGVLVDDDATRVHAFASPAARVLEALGATLREATSASLYWLSLLDGDGASPRRPHNVDSAARLLNVLAANVATLELLWREEAAAAEEEAEEEETVRELRRKATSDAAHAIQLLLQCAVAQLMACRRAHLVMALRTLLEPLSSLLEATDEEAEEAAEGANDDVELAACDDSVAREHMRYREQAAAAEHSVTPLQRWPIRAFASRADDDEAHDDDAFDAFGTLLKVALIEEALSGGGGGGGGSGGNDDEPYEPSLTRAAAALDDETRRAPRRRLAAAFRALHVWHACGGAAANNDDVLSADALLHVFDVRARIFWRAVAGVQRHDDLRRFKSLSSSSLLLAALTRRDVARLTAPLAVTRARPLALYPLPTTFQDLLVDARVGQRGTCDACGLVPAKPALCVLCGALVCVASACCFDDDAGAGEAYRHAARCNGGVGAFVMLRETYTLLLRAERATMWYAMFVDRFGEPDPHMRRGKPLHLSAKLARVVRLLLLTNALDQRSDILDSTRLSAQQH